MVWTSLRTRSCLFAILMLSVVLPSLPSTAEEPLGCVVEELPGVGTVCPQENGLYEVLADDGASLGYVHGTDPLPAEGLEPTAARPPACVYDAHEGYYARVIYAWASDRTPTRSDDTVRGLVHTANGVVHDEAAALGAERDLRVLCDPDGTVDVLRVELPTTLSRTTFSSVVQDLKAMEDTHDTADTRVHYWIYFEDRISCGCSGIGHVGNDQSAAVTNGNNGGSARYAVTFGYLSSNTMLHERAHNNGAVQNGSPNGSGGHHCNDGKDVMCYSDGGHKSDYKNTVCDTRRFDCNNDDYFHTDPPAGTYLSFAWNLGHVHNRYMRGCHEATGVLELGTGGLGVDGTMVGPVETQVPVECRGRLFLLEGWLPHIETPVRDQDAVADMDLCWYNGTTEIGCHSSVAVRESGLVPLDADSARIAAKAGAQVRYFLRVG